MYVHKLTYNFVPWGSTETKDLLSTTLTHMTIRQLPLRLYPLYHGFS